jgi:hypothetical protein
MRIIPIALLALVFAVATPAHGNEELAAAAAALEAAQARGQAEASRPGDEALTCEQIEAESIAVMNTPEMRAAMTASMVNSAQSMAQAEDMQNSMMGNTAANLALGVAGQFVPGLGMVQGMMMRNQMSAQAEESEELMLASLRNMEIMMPALMRSQRLGELAQAQNCAYLSRGLPPAQ